MFEKLAVLEAAPAAVARLFSINWYRNQIKGKQEVMIGYPDSGKDAGRLSAAWQLYEAQEELVKVAKEYGVKTRRAYPSCYITQPPGTICASLRLFVIPGTAPFPGKKEKKSNLAQKAHRMWIIGMLDKSKIIGVVAPLKRIGDGPVLSKKTFL